MTKYVELATDHMPPHPAKLPEQGGTFTLHRDGEPVALLRAVIRCDGDEVVRQPDGSVHVHGVTLTPEIEVVRPDEDVALRHVREAREAFRLDAPDIVQTGVRS